MRRSFLLRAGAIMTAAALSVGLLAAPGFARSKKLRPPPDVDLDPDRGMSFGRLSKNPFDRTVARPFNQAISPPGMTMDPAVDPYNGVVKSSRYEPQTGEIRGGLVDKRREMAQREEVGRPVRVASPAGFTKPKRPRTQGGQYVTPPTALSAAGAKKVDKTQGPPPFQARSPASLSLLPK